MKYFILYLEGEILKWLHEGWSIVLGACKGVVGYFKVVVGRGWHCMQQLQAVGLNGGVISFWG